MGGNSLKDDIYRLN
jgi:ATP-dependent RNA helicase DDX6/DHH1